MPKRIQKTKDLTSGPIFKQILLFSLPLMASSVLQLLFNTADTIVVGRWGGDTKEACQNALAAVGSCGSLTAMLVNLFLGLSVGAGICAAQELGARKYADVEKTVHTSALLALIAGILVSVLGICLAEPLLTLMGTDAAVLPEAIPYMQAYFCGMPASLLYNFCNAILNAQGETTKPMLFLTAAGIANVLLNLLMVLVFRLGAMGVGIATAASHFVSAGCIVAYMSKLDNPCRLDFKKLRMDKKKLFRILRLGLPAGLQDILFNFSSVIIQSSVNSLGAVAMAANAAASNITGYVYAAQSSTYRASMSFVGQNLGAGKFDRIKKSIIWCTLIGTVISCITSGIMILFGKPLLGLFAPGNTEVIETGMSRILVFGLTYSLCLVMEIAIGSLRGMGLSLLPTVTSLIGTCVFRLGWVLLVFPRFNTLDILYWSFPFSWAITAAVGFIFCCAVYRKKKARHLLTCPN